MITTLDSNEEDLTLYKQILRKQKELYSVEQILNGQHLNLLEDRYTPKAYSSAGYFYRHKTVTATSAKTGFKKSLSKSGDASNDLLITMFSESMEHLDLIEQQTLTSVSDEWKEFEKINYTFSQPTPLPSTASTSSNQQQVDTTLSLSDKDKVDSLIKQPKLPVKTVVKRTTTNLQQKSKAGKRNTAAKSLEDSKTTVIKKNKVATPRQSMNKKSGPKALMAVHN
ncbi:unnamed protein product [Didymodactylos carnosus]|uniref:Uncharacterized protein n=1 Tax=Didymodactylos carnosus TaxID=1234261 RepID=A0A815Y7C3_9BILA|nr:unnamed protein product [Didymodactylos carnosus]CAF1566506.1 unnamed protein product [Didymodactylos carnosus]CAF3843126.1 unnamed protein product [Didymodactylos carnosus]CAF4428837.1 unnamed protein product [Didymodactylos carnosus]